MRGNFPIHRALSRGVYIKTLVVYWRSFKHIATEGGWLDCSERHGNVFANLSGGDWKDLPRVAQIVWSECGMEGRPSGGMDLRTSLG